MLVPASMGAQSAMPDSVHLRNDCRLAEQVIATGNPAPRKQWALKVVWGCSDAGPAIATAFAAARGSTDTAYLNALTAPMTQLRDGQVFRTALDVAQDRGASTEARIFGMRVLILTLRPGYDVEYPRLLNNNGLCFSPPGEDWRVTEGTPLPPGADQMVRALGTRLVHDPSEIATVQRAALCLLYAATRP